MNVSGKESCCLVCKGFPEDRDSTYAKINLRMFQGLLLSALLFWDLKSGTSGKKAEPGYIPVEFTSSLRSSLLLSCPSYRLCVPSLLLLQQLCLILPFVFLHDSLTPTRRIILPGMIELNASRSCKNIYICLPPPLSAQWKGGWWQESAGRFLCKPDV